MKSRIGRAAITAIAACACFGAPARAEVSAETGPSGAYVRTVVFSTFASRNVRIWTVVKARPALRPLNPDGDLNGDLWPVIRESSGPVRTPWVAWSRFNGVDYDIAFSRWNRAAGAWMAIGWVEPTAQAGDDLDPQMAIDATNRPHLVWWRNEGGVGRVYLSVWLASRWMTAFPVSDPGVDSVDPTISVLPDKRILIQYETAEGRVTRVVSFSRPFTITDDITPFGRFTIEDSENLRLGSR